MSKRKNRLPGKSRNGRPGSNVMAIHKKAKEGTREIATKVRGETGEVTIEKKRVSRRVTDVEYAHVKLNEMREQVLRQQKIIADLRQQKSNAETRCDKLEIQLSVIGNEKFRHDAGLEAGLNLYQDVESGEWFWGEKAPVEVVKTIKAGKVEANAEDTDDVDDDIDDDEGSDEDSDENSDSDAPTEDEVEAGTPEASKETASTAAQ